MAEIADHDLIERIYDGAIGADRFGPALQALAAHVGAGGANVHVVDRSNLATLVFLPVGEKYTQRAVDEYFTHWRHLNPYRSAMRRARGVFLCHEHVGAKDLDRSAYAQDFYFAIGERWLAGVVLNTDPRFDISIVFNRGADQAHFDDYARHVIGAFAPHVRRAASLLAARGANADTRSLLAAFANTKRPAWLVGGDARIVWANAAALELMQKGDVLQGRDDKLGAVHPDVHDRLGRQIRLATARAFIAQACETISCFDAIGRIDLEVFPASAPDPALRSVRALALVLGQRRGLMPDAEQRLRVRYGLTPAEASLAIEVANGAALEDIAETRQVAMKTVRSQLYAIYAKTATGRQAALSALIWRDLAS